MGTTEQASSGRLNAAIRLHYHAKHRGIRMNKGPDGTMASAVTRLHLRSKARTVGLNRAVAGRWQKDIKGWRPFAWPAFRRHKKGQIKRFSLTTAWACQTCSLCYRGARPENHKCKCYSKYFTDLKMNTLRRDRDEALELIAQGSDIMQGFTAKSVQELFSQALDAVNDYSQWRA